MLLKSLEIKNISGSPDLRPETILAVNMLNLNKIFGVLLKNISTDNGRLCPASGSLSSQSISLQGTLLDFFVSVRVKFSVYFFMIIYFCCD